MKKRCVLVTGGAGFIGSHVNKLLNKTGYETVVYDNLSQGDPRAVVVGKFIEGDLGDINALNKLFSEYKFDAIMHLAALTDVGESVKNPLKYYQQNVCYSLNLIKIALQTSPCPIIFSSSAAVYGTPHSPTITENDPLLPINPYGLTKKYLEEILADCHYAYKVPYVCLRYFNAAGGDPEGEIKNYSLQKHNLIPLILRNIKNKDLKAEIYGNDYPTHDGTCIRDYIHVQDLAQAHISAMEYLFHGGTPTAFNLGNENGYSVHEVLTAIQKITNTQLNIKIGPKRQGDPAALIANSKKARKILSWIPKFPNLDNIIEDAWLAMNESALRGTPSP